MKKMMIIAAIASMMLIPAQMDASNMVNNKPRVEYNKKGFDKKGNRKFKDDRAYKKFDNRRDYDKRIVYKKRKPNKPVVAKRPRRRPLPPPPPPARIVYIM